MADRTLPEIFADGVGAYRFSGGVVRIDLISATEALDQKDSKQAVVTHRVIMPLEGFLRTVSSLNDMAKQMVDAGVLKQRPAGEAEAAPANGEATA